MHKSKVSQKASKADSEEFGNEEDEIDEELEDGFEDGDSEESDDESGDKSLKKKRKAGAPSDLFGLTKKQRKDKIIECRNEKFLILGPVFTCTGGCTLEEMDFSAFSRKAQERLIQAEGSATQRKDVCKSCAVSSATTEKARTTGSSKSVMKREGRVFRGGGGGRGRGRAGGR
eukprot:CAMPEP_0196573964 /NCGR_PEP_ID=MMETSP1081-20130531/3780_1 /TAXON_ID=36882 /ORGANISM="Pyramimonas amylifera, Strain CCMP720" /LENGTH=172 /DNA_ID=CAMNT_0041891843 /DNA_START=316 /DNA_END=831 /DNA_ORIENTATION=+